MKYKVGDIFEFDGVKVEVVESPNCTGCPVEDGYSCADRCYKLIGMEHTLRSAPKMVEIKNEWEDLSVRGLDIASGKDCTIQTKVRIANGKIEILSTEEVD